MTDEFTRRVDDVAEPDEEDIKHRFLKKRTVQNADSNYHPSHNKNSVAEIPDLLTGVPLGEDTDLTLMLPPLEEVDEEDLTRLRKATTHLSDDLTFRLLAYYEYDIDTTIHVAKQMAAPDLMPEVVKDMMVANIATERDFHPTKKMPYKEFYFKTEFRKAVDPQTLVDFYYNEKNKIEGNWRLELWDLPPTAEEQEVVKKILEAGKIQIVKYDAPRQTRVQRAMATRLANRLRRGEPEGSQELELVDSDSVSRGSTEPAPSEKSETGTPIRTTSSEANDVTSPVPSTPSTSATNNNNNPRINLKFRFNPSKLNTSSPDIRIITTSPTPTPEATTPEATTPTSSKSTPSSDGSGGSKKKRWHRRSIEQQRGGAQKSYPERKRKAPSVFE